jgi:2-keto-myo-inositol isomerase
MKACLNQDTLRTTPTETFIQIARKAGFDAIELTIDKVEPIIAKGSLESLREEIAEQELAVASINGPENFNLLSDAEFQSTLSQTRDLASAAKEIGCDLLVPVPAPMKPGLSRTATISQTVEALTRLADVCGEIKLGLEFLGMHECSVNNLETAVEVTSRVGRPNVGLVIDSFHMYVSESPFTEIAANIQKTFIVHVNDSEPGSLRTLTDANRVFPGEGSINLTELRQVLETSGYDGFISLELLRPAYWEEDPERIAKKGRECLKRAFGI